jgi:penicillin-binding protein 2
MALATKGNLYTPHTLAAVYDKQTGTKTPVQTELRKMKVSSSTWNVVREGMRRVVMEPGGTGGLAKIKGISVAGKTGTAENPHGKSHSWFIGFAPFDQPRIAIVVLVENAGYGGSFAAPIAGMCMEEYLYGRLIRFDPDVETKQVKNDVPVEQNGTQTPSGAVSAQGTHR